MILFNDEDERNQVKQYKQLTGRQRYYIERSLQEKSYADIAKSIGVDKSTISREVKRNSVVGIYQSQTAGKLMRKRKKACKKKYVLVGCSFEDVSQKELTRVQNKLNYRPRKCLGFKTPKEVIDEETGVALAN